MVFDRSMTHSVTAFPFRMDTVRVEAAFDSALNPVPANASALRDCRATIEYTLGCCFCIRSWFLLSEKPFVFALTHIVFHVLEKSESTVRRLMA